MKLMTAALPLVLLSVCCRAEDPSFPGTLPPAWLEAPSLTESRLTIAPEGSAVVLTFAGTLQSAPTPDGPWADIPEARSPFRPAVGAGPVFYRSLEADSIFSEGSVVEFSLSGPLQQHFELALAGMPDGIFPPPRPKPYFDGVLTLSGRDVPVTVRVRGNSSLQECPFPKLKFKVSRADRAGTPFFDAREIKIGTHCAEGGRGSIGRLREEAATYREALAYEVMDRLGFVSPRVRRARIRYVDTSPAAPERERGWTWIRSALILDDPEVVGERLGGRALSDEEIGALSGVRLDAQLITDLRCLHVLLGNWDFGLSTDGRNLWNTEVMALPDGTLLPMAGDFDLASWVTENVLDSVPHDYRPDLPLIDRRARFELEQIQKSTSREQFGAARSRFFSKRGELESLVQGAVIDAVGRTNCLRHLEAFYQAWPDSAR